MTHRFSAKKMVLEVIAIFLGVTLGFLAEDYRESRDDRRRGSEVLGQLLQDLNLDSLDIDPIGPQSATRETLTLWLNNSAATRFPVDTLQAVLDSLGRTGLASYEASSFTYSALRASGRIDLLRDVDLRRRIVHYFEDRQPAMEQINNGLLGAETEWWKALAPHVDLQPASSLLFYPGARVRDVRGLAGDGEWRFATANLGSWAQVQRELVTQMLELNGSLAGAIREELSR